MQRKTSRPPPTLKITVTFAECGKVQTGTTLSLGSEFSRPGQWPWYAPIFFVEGNKFVGGSSIISRKYLLTGKTLLYY
jgi:hypothetical protein